MILAGVVMDNLSLLIKPTHKCNLNCWYCYNRQYEIKDDMTLELVERAAHFAKNSAKHVIWTWHGGEPLLMPIEFYIEAERILRKYDINDVAIQSNGTLLDKLFIEKFKKWKWRFSMSFDGLSNDLSRGHTQKILNSLQLYKESYHPIGIIKVVNQKNLHTLHEDYNYVKPYVNAFDFNLIFKTDKATSLSDDYINQYLEQYTLLLNKWINDPNPIMIRNFGKFLDYFLDNDGYLCSYRGGCFNHYLCVDPTGDLYPCDSWVPKEFCYGNIKEFENMDEIKRGKVFTKIKEVSKERMDYCKNCEIFSLCNGGCLAVAIVESGGNRPDKNLCNLRKKEISHFFNTIKNLNPAYIKNHYIRESMFKVGFRNIPFIKSIMEG